MSDSEARMKPLTNRYLATLLLSMTARTAMADRLVDPTQPASSRPATNGESLSVRLEAILQSGERRIAIVNGQIVRAGDRIGAIQILQVNESSVSYSQAGETHLARLQETSMQVRHNVVHPKEAS